MRFIICETPVASMRRAAPTTTMAICEGCEREKDGKDEREGGRKGDRIMTQEGKEGYQDFT
jgi:hypothetical protein